MENIQVPAKMRAGRSRGDDGGPPTVLLADDDEDFRCALAELLAAEGLRVIGVPSGEEALAVLDLATKARSRSPDLLVLDLMMPRLSGIEVLQRLRKSTRWAQLPVLVVTGANDPMLRVRLDLPIAFKPDTDVVLESVRQLLSAQALVAGVDAS
jgi:CheY-like chemotaxis protein